MLKPTIVQKCETCHETYPLESRLGKCPTCAKNVEFEIKQFHIHLKRRNFYKDLVTKRNDMWRYQKLIPVRPKSIISDGEGNTPIIYLDDLSRLLNIHLFVKDESRNPTGTFKDREASLVISRSKDLGQDNLVLQSTGNTGLAITYYATLANLTSYFFGPKISNYKLLIPKKGPKNKIILIDGTPLEIKDYAENFAKKYNFTKLSPFSERCEANATLAYEDFESNFHPDYYVQTVAAGMGPIGYFTGHQRLAQWGLINGKRLPKIIGVQISQFNPLYKGWQQDKAELDASDNMTVYPRNPFEPTLFTTNAPAYYPQFRDIIKNSGGEIIQVAPQEASQYENLLACSLGHFGIKLNQTAEKSPFIGFSGLVKARMEGIIPSGATVLLLITGKGAHVKNRVLPDAIIKPGYDMEKLMAKLWQNKIGS